MSKQSVLFFVLSFLAVTSQQAFYFVDFDESMQSKNYTEHLQKKINHMVIHYFRMLYANAQSYNLTINQLRIPKVIHQIWLGSPFPDEYRLFQESWLRHHPGWIFKLWTESDINSFNWKNKDLFDAACNYGEKSDIWRYEILEQFGGLYIDVDMECLKSLNKLHHLFDFYVGIQPLDTQCVQLGVGIIGSIPHHPLLEKCIEELRSFHSQQIIIKTGPLFFTKQFLRYSPEFGLQDIALPAGYFYPCFYAQKGLPKSIWQRPESLAVHHWAGSWLKKEAFVH